MIRTRPDSIIEIWSNYYIKYPNKREKKDQNVQIIQLEQGTGGTDYIVEFIRLSDNRCPYDEESFREYYKVLYD